MTHMDWVVPCRPSPLEIKEYGTSENANPDVQGPDDHLIAPQ